MPALLNYAHMETIQAKSSTAIVWKKQHRHRELFYRVNFCNPKKEMRVQMVKGYLTASPFTIDLVSPCA